MLFYFLGVMHQVRWLKQLDINSDSPCQSKESSNNRSDSVFSSLPPLIPINPATAIAIANCDNHSSTFSPSILPVSASDLSSDNAMHFPGSGLWGSSSSVATTFEGIQSSASASSGTDESHSSNVSQM